MITLAPLARTIAALTRATVALILASAALADAPKVVKATPDNGDSNVDPKTKEIRIEFDQDMSHTGHSFCGGGDHFPKISGKPRWVNKSTIVISVVLKPNWEYSFSINCPAAGNFRNEAGESAEVYPISFTTGTGKGGDAGGKKLTPEDNRPAVAELKRTVQEEYSYSDRLKLDWEKLFADHGPKMEKAETPAAFARAAGAMLAEAKDIHIWLKVGEQTIGSFKRFAPPNCDMKTLARIVPGWKQHNKTVYSGRFEDGIGYIMIATWSRDEGGTGLEPAYEALGDMLDAKGIIIDVRTNAGGAEPLAQDFAGCFVAKSAVYSKHDYRDASAPGGFGKPSERRIEPKKGRPAFKGKIAVLMGPQNMSTCESFLAMMRYGAKATLFGEKSWGSSGNPKPHELPNGVTVFLPSWRDMLPDGSSLEGVGIKPDVEVKAELKEFQEKDPVLDAALSWMRR